jgi:hypothetical protein
VQAEEEIQGKHEIETQPVLNPSSSATPQLNEQFGVHYL